jgi:UDP-N-acetyl-D-mannosaminouronate:lipid I N-acetyl-D-mannosaminouronosyltransferase
MQGRSHDICPVAVDDERCSGEASYDEPDHGGRVRHVSLYNLRTGMSQPCRQPSTDGSNRERQIFSYLCPMDAHPTDSHHRHIGSGSLQRIRVRCDEGPEGRLPTIWIQVGDDEHTQRGRPSEGAVRKGRHFARPEEVLRTNESNALYSSAVTPDAQPPSSLHSRAAALFPSASIRGLITFAPPTPADMVDLLDGNLGILLAINAEKIAHADPAVADLSAKHLGYPDGVGAVLALRRRGIKATRMPGAGLWLNIVQRYAGRLSFFLVGSTEEVIQTVTKRLVTRHPGIRLRSRNGYLSEPDIQDLAAEIGDWKPDFVFVATGSPRQEILMERLFSVHPAVYMGLGGSFDIYAGRKPRAPRWLQRLGLEWAYRLVREPMRLRRLPTYLRFAALLAAGRC